MKMSILKAMLAVVLAITGLTITACSGADPQPLSGDNTHVRHATGMESQTRDY